MLVPFKGIRFEKLPNRIFLIFLPLTFLSYPFVRVLYIFVNSGNLFFENRKFTKM